MGEQGGTTGLQLTVIATRAGRNGNERPEIMSATPMRRVSTQAADPRIWEAWRTMQEGAGFEGAPYGLSDCFHFAIAASASSGVVVSTLNASSAAITASTPGLLGAFAAPPNSPI